jgi:hypothetical protein
MILLFYYSYPFHIQKTSNLYSYSNNICSAYVFNNICIRIRICYKNMKWIWEEHYPICI